MQGHNLISATMVKKVRPKCLSQIQEGGSQIPIIISRIKSNKALRDSIESFNFNKDERIIGGNKEFEQGHGKLDDFVVDKGVANGVMFLKHEYLFTRFRAVL